MKQSRSREVNIHSSKQEILHLYGTRGSLP
jgi:hypothetical protein